MFSRFKKLSLGAAVTIFFAVTFFGNFLYAKPARAIPVEDFWQMAREIYSDVGTFIDAALISAGTRMATHALQKIAYDSAVYIATGNKGQGPIFDPREYGQMLKDVGNDAVGVAIEELGKEAGMNLCKPPDIKIDLALRIGLRTQFTTPGGNAPAKPNCTLASFTKNWKETGSSKFFSGGDLTKAFNLSLKGDDQSDFGFYTQATEKIAGRVLSQQTATTLDRQEGQGVKTKKELTSNKVVTPAAANLEILKANTPDKAIADQQAQLNAALSSGNAKIFPSVLAIFFSTLGTNLLKRFESQGVVPSSILSSASTDPLSYSGSGLSAIGRSAAQSFFSYLTTATDNIKQPSTYDLVAQLSSCPESPGMYNCRAGDDLINAANQGLTIREALKRNVLVGDHQLIPPSAERYAAQSNDTNCYRTGYCLNNVKVLRQVRVLPLGFEIAVMKSNPDKPWRLKDVVDGFNNCGKDSVGNLVADSAHPYCHLIDPNWVLKVPDAKCNALAYTGSLLSSDVPDRLQDCVDLQTCVGYDANGNCANYAYCAAEKNTWKFTADTCESQYATCKSFQNANGQSVSYLYRTLDTGACTADNVGCTAYSLSQNAAGQWQAPGFSAGKATNNGAYFNDQLSTSCSANSAGCTEFVIASSTLNSTYLTKAPDYLKCYDTNPSTEAIDWPKTPADLNKVSSNPLCDQFAQVCIPDETSCSWYTPVAGGSRIPGRYTPAETVIAENNETTVTAWHDQCHAKCVGYDAYREMPSAYSAGTPVAYIIPSSGQTCSEEDVGCSSFTNMSTTTGGMEQTEYFSRLRPCEKPSPSVASETYITYEGSATAGFQLKTYLLVKDTDGSPKYFAKDENEERNFDALCSESKYKSGDVVADCRQFNDPKGNIYYKLLAKTIPLTNSCTPYRVNNPEVYVVDGVTKCYQNGVYKDGSCFYNGLPGGVNNTAGTSRVCSAAVESCAAFKGAAGNVVKEIFYDDFEGKVAVPGEWSTNGAAISKESTNVNGHSLQYQNSADSERTLGNLEPGFVYELSYWAKGTGNLDVWFFTNTADHRVGTFRPVTLGDSWKEYQSTVVLEGNDASLPVRLGFTNGTVNNFFIDNIRLVKVSGYQYLVKKSLSVDPVCDSDATDNLPGEALGCRAYTDIKNEPVYLTGFTSLCRENAIRCTALFDTHNANSTAASAYNVQLSGTGGSVPRIYFSEKDAPSCEIPVGKTSCFVNVIGHTKEEIEQKNINGSVQFVPSTVYVPPRSTAEAVYLVANENGTCREQDVGCTLAGKQVYDGPGVWHFATTTIKNDPSGYDKTLCTAEAVGCNAFTDGADSRFFKDPAVTGQSVCTFQTGISYRGTTVDGWFQKSPLPSVCSITGKSCTSNAQCGAADGVCVAAPTPCYPNYVLSDGSLGIWSYGNQGVGRYNNFVGECPATADKCTEFVDHTDNNRSYYLKKDDKLGPGTCDGLVSQRAGCALFDEVDLPDKKYNTKDTYAKSNEGNSSRNPLDPTFVEPITAGNLDSNIILQVKPDRECGEWLQCRNSYSIYDSKKGAYRSVCASIQRCSAGSRAGECGAGTVSSYTNQVLSEQFYLNRPLGWDKMDYDGYSLLGLYPLDELEQINFAVGTADPDWRLAKKLFGAGTAQSAYCDPRDSDNKYVERGDCNLGGTCINHTCVVGIGGKAIPKSPLAVTDQPPQHLCRAYPEATSPFPSTTAILASPIFKEARLCTEADHCECDYVKAEYGSVTPIYDNISNAANLPAGICQGGARDGLSCVSTVTDPKSCTDGTTMSVPGSTNPALVQYQQDGTCLKKQKQYEYVGWKGFCVERDSSRTLNADEFNKACLTWFPIESLIGATDIYNLHYEAGYQTPTQNGRYYCTDARSRGDQTFTLKFGAAGLGDAICRSDSGVENPNCTDYGYGAPQQSYDDNYFTGRKFFATFDRAHINVTNATYGFGGSQPFPIDNSLSNIIKEDVEQVTLKVISSFCQSNCVPSSQIFTLVPNDLNSIGSPQSYYTQLSNNTSDPKTVEGGFYKGSSNDLVLFYSSNADSSQLTQGGDFSHENSIGRGLVGNLFNQVALFPGDLWANPPQNKFVQGTSPSCTTNPTTHVTTCVNVRDKSKDTGFCPIQSNSSGNYGSWHALRLHFNPISHKFESIDTAFCDGNYPGGDAVPSFYQPRNVTYEITFRLKKWCTKVSDVTVSLSGNTNSAVAWTDRMWQFSGFEVPNLNIKFPVVNQPFGSINSSKPNVEPLALSGVQLPQSPTNCGGAKMCTFSLGGNHAVYGGVPYSTNAISNTEGPYRLGTLFAKAFGIYNYTLGSGYVAGDATQPNFTETGDPLTNQKPVPPQIHPVINCTTEVTNNAARRVCEEGPGRGFTINEVSSGNLYGAEASSLKANMNFYMFADKNQMPIRKVTIDWGDGRDNVVIEGAFRNQRGTAAMTCRLDTGNSATPVDPNAVYACADAAGNFTNINNEPYGSCTGPGADCGNLPEKCYTNNKGIEICTPGAALFCIEDKNATPNPTPTPTPDPAAQIKFCFDSAGNKFGSCETNDQCLAAPQCLEETKAPDFGHITDKTCDNAYFHAENTYYCSPDSPYIVNSAQACGPAYKNNVGCCIFVPRVQVIDNWGWCNGTCRTLDNGTTGCYNKENNGGIDECTSVLSGLVNAHWTYFGGAPNASKVIVAPQ